MRFSALFRRFDRQTQKAKRSRAFTLMEMLIVVAIIAILIAIAIPVFSSQLEKSRLSVCEANRRSLLSLVYAQSDLESSDPQAALKASFQANYTQSDDGKSRYICPDGGRFLWENDHIGCTKHDLTVPNTVLMDYQTIVEDWKNLNIPYASNDLFRDYLKNKYGGNWPAMKLDGSDTALYVQPYYNSTTKELSIFASTQQENGHWFTQYVYYDGVWYTPTAQSDNHSGISMTADNYQELISTWKPVTVTYLS